MTREPFRRLERRLTDLEDGDGDPGSPTFAFRDDRTGELEDADGNSVDPENHGAGQLIIVTHSIVMTREDAEREGREILGPAEGAPEGRDVVRVADDDSAFRRGRQ